MFDWLVAGTYCEEEYGMTLNTEEGYFVCPECGEPYVAGGQTTTVTKTKPDNRFSVGMKDNQSGKLLNVAV